MKYLLLFALDLIGGSLIGFVVGATTAEGLLIITMIRMWRDIREIKEQRT